MSVTLEVSRCERSREASEEQPSNISPMPVTLEVSRCERSMDSISSKSLKRRPDFSGAETPLSTTTDLTSHRLTALRGSAISPDTPSVG